MGNRSVDAFQKNGRLIEFEIEMEIEIRKRKITSFGGCMSNGLMVCTFFFMKNNPKMLLWLLLNMSTVKHLKTNANHTLFSSIYLCSTRQFRNGKFLFHIYFC